MLEVVTSVCTQLNVLRVSNFAQQRPTTRRNNVQHLATGCALRVCKRTQHVASNDVRKPCAKSDATLLANNSQHCWILHVASLYTLLHFVAIFWELLHLFVHLFNTDANNTQHCWHNIVGICCVRLHDAALGCVQTDATTPNIVAPKMLGVVACVLAMVCKRMHQLPTMLGLAVHRGKETTHKSL